ncbi:MAG TPA: hypothetical protein VK116_07155, partial [Planctomycetota bacterium]|nr:hypothetical protein [Planctomycetota bacterium]
AYRTTVRAETIDSRLHPLSRSVLQSAVCGPTPPIPLDVYLSVTAITADATGEPGATVRVRYFDYTKGDYEAKASVSVKQRDFIDPATERFQIFQIDSQRQVIVVRDNKVRRGMKLEFGAGATKVRYRPEDIQAWDPLECCTGAEAAVEGEVIEETDASATLDASADEASAAPEPTESEPMETESEPDTTEPESTPTGGSGRRPRF